MSLETVEQDAACGTCAYWAELADGIGQCRRYAPRPRTGTDQVVWPATEEYEYCGEYEQNESFCDCDDGESCPICDDINTEFDAIVGNLYTIKQSRWRWWGRRG